MSRPVRDRLVLPILLPVGILVVLGLVLFGFSRILLAVSHTAATATATRRTAVAVARAVAVAARPVIRGTTFLSMVGAITGIAMLAGGAAILLAPGGEEGGGEGPTVTVAIVAQGIAYTTTAVTAPAEEPFLIAFDNQDPGIPHNVEIFDNPDFTGSALFAGELITGPAQITYEVPALPAGTFSFRCIVHPQMIGTIETAEGGGEAVQGPTVIARGLAFDATTLELAANTATIITMDNQDAGVPHNIAVFADDTLATVLYRGDLVTGPTVVDYELPPLPAGTYYFHCDVHPTMAGDVVVT
ncbi:MAG: cupredoxin domain-containing protein [Actinomycetota bacterium]